MPAHVDAAGQQLLFDADRYCARCGRRLTTEASYRRGYGKTCWRKVQSENAGGGHFHEFQRGQQ